MPSPESPAKRTVTEGSLWIGFAVGLLEEGLLTPLVPVLGVSVLIDVRPAIRRFGGTSCGRRLRGAVRKSYYVSIYPPTSAFMGLITQVRC
jgi:hypothetical protein